MSEWPAGWARAPLGEVGELQLGKMLDRARNVGRPTPYLRNINVRWGRFDLDDLLTVPLSDDERDRFEVRDGDLFVCEGGEPGRAAVWRDGPTGIKYQKAIHRVRLADGVSPELLSLYLRHLANSRDLEDHFTGTTIKHLPREVLARLPVPVPPAPQALRIVAKLDRLSARSRAARDHLARTAKLAARAKQAILAAAFQGALTADWREVAQPRRAEGDPHQIDGRARVLDDLPASWAWASLGSVTLVSGGLTKNPKRAELPSKAPYLRVANVYANELRLDNVAEIGCTPTEVVQTTLQPDDLLVVEGNGSLDQIGRVAIWRGEIDGCLHQNHIIRVRSGARLMARYGLYWLLSPAGRSAIEVVASSSSGLHTLSISKVKGLPVPLCALDEQREIVRRIEAAFARIDRLTAEATRAAHLLDRLDERLLAKAFRGELVPQDPSDEPAEALLARIRTARSETPRPRRGRRPRAT